LGADAGAKKAQKEQAKRAFYLIFYHALKLWANTLRLKANSTQHPDNLPF